MEAYLGGMDIQVYIIILLFVFGILFTIIVSTEPQDWAPISFACLSALFSVLYFAYSEQHRGADSSFDIDSVRNLVKGASLLLIIAMIGFTILTGTNYFKRKKMCNEQQQLVINDVLGPPPYHEVNIEELVFTSIIKGSISGIIKILFDCISMNKINRDQFVGLIKQVEEKLEEAKNGMQKDQIVRDSAEKVVEMHRYRKKP